MTATIVGEQLQQSVLGWLDHHHPDWSMDWFEGDLAAYLPLPLVIRTIPACILLEHDMIKGGWPQFLWNCFGGWRPLLETVREAYGVIGDSSHELAALVELQTLCEAGEAECRRLLEAEGDPAAGFGQFVAHGRAIAHPDWQRLFWPGAAAYWRRLKWLGNQESVVRRFLAIASP